ncbi:MAG: XRE family transcriptional regulator [Eubacteriaceae bacterium]|jgi:transcriptional regulator with XRE-family HTH domain|nr:XRE family transcriptional regulator [Eubacteriaceae bacterium]
MTENESPNQISEAIASNIRSLRKSRKMSMGDVAEVTGVSKSMLGQIERGESSPTISTLSKISTGLNIPFAALLETKEKGTMITGRNDITPITGDDTGFRLYPFFPLKASRSFELFDAEIDGNVESDNLPRESNTEGFIIVFQGTLELTLNGTDLYLIHSGSSISFRADQKHTFRNPDDELCRFCLVINYRKQ